MNAAQTIAILNLALTLEFLERDFDDGALRNRGAGTGEQLPVARTRARRPRPAAAAANVHRVAGRAGAKGSRARTMSSMSLPISGHVARLGRRAVERRLHGYVPPAIPAYGGEERPRRSAGDGERAWKPRDGAEDLAPSPV